MENLIKKFFNRETKQHDWGENILVEIKTKTVQPDKRLSFNETSENVRNEIMKQYEVGRD